MSSERRGIDRRDFVRHSIGAGAGALVLGPLSGEAARARRGGSAGIPLIITSHTNETGQEV